MQVTASRRVVLQGLAATAALTHDYYTMDGRIRSVKDVAQYIINTTPGIPKVSFAEVAARGIIRVDHSESFAWQHEDSPYHHEIVQSGREKKPYETFTGRQGVAA